MFFLIIYTLRQLLKIFWSGALWNAYGQHLTLVLFGLAINITCLKKTDFLFQTEVVQRTSVFITFSQSPTFLKDSFSQMNVPDNVKKDFGLNFVHHCFKCMNWAGDSSAGDVLPPEWSLRESIQSILGKEWRYSLFP